MASGFNISQWAIAGSGDPILDNATARLVSSHTVEASIKNELLGNQMCSNPRCGGGSSNSQGCMNGVCGGSSNSFHCENSSCGTQIR